MKKGELELDKIVKWSLALAALVLILIFIGLMATGKLQSTLASLFSLRFGR